MLAVSGQAEWRVQAGDMAWVSLGHDCRKTEVMNLLESAGFSRANPYYVVQQGKVLTT